MGRTGSTRQRSRNSRSNQGTPFRGGDPLTIFDGLCVQTLVEEGREVVATGDPLDAEMWVSHLLGMFSGLPLVGKADAAEAIGGRLVSVAQRRRTPEAQMCLRAIAAVAGDGLARRAKKAIASLGTAATQVPAWTKMIGAAKATSAWRASDLCGDQDSVMVAFRYPDGTEHCLLVLIDHLLGGIAKDVAILSSPLAETLQQWEGPEFDLVEEGVAEAASRVMAAVGVTARTIAAPITEDYTEAVALLSARFGPVAADLDVPAPLAVVEREDLVRQFLAAEPGRKFADDPDAWFLLDALVDFRCDAGADPLRWSDSAVELFLLHWVPRKLSAEEIVLQRAPEVLRAWVPWASACARLPAFLVEEALDAIDEIGDEALKALSDQSRWGPAKQVAMRMLADGVDPADGDAVDEWLLNRVG
jgi:hypothetical protein